jgi:hypothetical protein
VSANPLEIFRRYIWAGPLTRNADAVAAMFAVDGVFEAPLVPAGQAFPRRIEGREAIRTALADFYERDAARQAGAVAPEGDRGEVPVRGAHDHRP